MEILIGGLIMLFVLVVGFLSIVFLVAFILAKLGLISLVRFIRRIK